MRETWAPPNERFASKSAVLSGERHTLLDTLIDDQITDFGESINIGFPGTEIAAFDRVVEQAKNAVAIVLVIFRGINSALGGDAMGAARAILVTEALHVIAELAQRRRGRSSREPAADDDDFEFSPVIRSDQARVVLMVRPFLGEGAVRNSGLEVPDHNCCAGFTR